VPEPGVSGGLVGLGVQGSEGISGLRKAGRPLILRAPSLLVSGCYVAANGQIPRTELEQLEKSPANDHYAAARPVGPTVARGARAWPRWERAFQAHCGW